MVILNDFQTMFLVSSPGSHGLFGFAEVGSSFVIQMCFVVAPDDHKQNQTTCISSTRRVK